MGCWCDFLVVPYEPMRMTNSIHLGPNIMCGLPLIIGFLGIALKKIRERSEVSEQSSRSLQWCTLAPVGPVCYSFVAVIPFTRLRIPPSGTGAQTLSSPVRDLPPVPRLAVLPPS